MLIQGQHDTFHIIDGITRDTLSETLREAQETHGSENVALLLRLDTYHFYGEQGIIRPKDERIIATY